MSDAIPVVGKTQVGALGVAELFSRLGLHQFTGPLAGEFLFLYILTDIRPFSCVGTWLHQLFSISLFIFYYTCIYVRIYTSLYMCMCTYTFN